MSEEKKAYAEAAYVNPQENKSAPAAVTDTHEKSDGEGAGRGKTQGVLPGILGKQLRAAYGELLNSPVPDRFNDLIQKLQQRETAATTATDSRDEEESK
ncbi:MAG: NepR family anti-sigma factor [Hyphomicrobium sp.]|jgi:hypothetical protein